MKQARFLPAFFGCLWLVLMFVLVACAAPAAADPVPVEPRAPDVQPAAGMANPASAHCQEQGYTLEMRTDQSGGAYGVCIFPDGSECEEWAYFRGECAPADASQPAAVTDTPAAEPPQPPQLSPQPVVLPAGILVNSSTGVGLTLYGRDGQVIGEWLTSQPAPDGPGYVHMAGPAAAQGLSVPLVFLGSQDDLPWLLLSQEGSLTPLLSLGPPQQFGGLAGVPGQPVLAYVSFEPAEAGAVLRSKLYLASHSLDELAAAQPALAIDSRESSYLQPVALHTGEAGLDGVWYTYTLWGVGGGPLLDPHQGLFYLDLASGASLQVLGLENGFSGLSPDQSWVAYSTGQPDPGLVLNNLLGGEMAAFARLPGSQAGPSFAAISPGNIYVAWQEANGSLMEDNYQGTLRVGMLAGGAVIDFPDSFFLEKIGGIAGGSLASIQVRPVGWLDDQVLLVSLRLPQKGESLVLGLDVTRSEIILQLSGRFTGLVYSHK